MSGGYTLDRKLKLFLLNFTILGFEYRRLERDEPAYVIEYGSAILHSRLGGRELFPAPHKRDLDRRDG